jgi:Ca2+-binding EF-hand superfamily protein
MTDAYCIKSQAGFWFFYVQNCSAVSARRAVLSCTTDWLSLTGSGELEFEEFVTLAARFLVEEDAEAMQQELREAFRLYDKEGKFLECVC